MEGRPVAPNGLSVILSVDPRRRDARLGGRVERYGRRGREAQDGGDECDTNFAQCHRGSPFDCGCTQRPPGRPISLSVLSVDRGRRDARLGRRVDRYGRCGGERQDGRDQCDTNLAQSHRGSPLMRVAHARQIRRTAATVSGTRKNRRGERC
jgi:hypothetical protein